MPNPFGAVFGLVLAAACVTIALAEYRRTRELVSPLILFALLAVFDIYLPGAIYALRPPDGLSPWLDADAVVAAVTPAMIVFTVGLIFFVAGYVAVHRRAPRPVARAETGDDARPRRRALLLLAVFAGWYAWTLAFKSAAYGSFETFITQGLLDRSHFEPMSMQYPGEPYVVVLGLEFAGEALATSLVLIGLLFWYRQRNPGLFAFLLPAAGVFGVAMTFFRGSILIYFLGLAVVESAITAPVRVPRLGVWVNRNALLLLVVAVVCFLGYGVARDRVAIADAFQRGVTDVGFVTPSQTPAAATHAPSRSPAANAPSAAPASGPATVEAPSILQGALLVEAQRFIRGEGVLGLSSILAFYPSEHEYLGGKTIRDMLLLPIPRTIWKDKPEWYGVSDITRAMGEPAATQSAVTMPGELYANFGLLGLSGMFVYGMFFGLFHRLRHGRRGRALYAFVLLPSMFVTFWMGWTGFTNAMVAVVPAIATLLVVYPPMPRRVVGRQAVAPTPAA